MSLEVAIVSVPVTWAPPPCRKKQRVTLVVVEGPCMQEHIKKTTEGASTQKGVRNMQNASTPNAPHFGTRRCWSALRCPRRWVPWRPHRGCRVPRRTAMNTRKVAAGR
eukprot:scaffold12559_cov63-Phaeocystis_antarctica.AAC.1